MLCKIYPLGENDAIPTENTKVNRLDFSDLYDEVEPADMNDPSYVGDKPTEFATEAAWNVPANTAVYSFKKPQENMEVKHLDLEETYDRIRAFKGKYDREM